MQAANEKPDEGPKKDRKFFFDMNDFTEPDPNGPPEPPTYTQEELDSAKSLAMEQGRQKGLNESAESRDQAIAATLQQISTQFATLFSAEQEREERYEDEVLLLTIRALEKLFPVLNEKVGTFEIERTVRETLKKVSGKSEITIHIAPDFIKDVEAVVTPLRDKEINPPSFHILGDDVLQAGDCRLSWKDGGAMRDSKRLSEEILANLRALLPEEAFNSDVPPEENDDIKEQAAPNQTAAALPDQAPEQQDDVTEPKPEPETDHE